MTLNNAQTEQEYIIKSIETDDEELKSFLFSLGCYSGESVAVISKKKKGITLAVKGSRYSIDIDLAKAIIV